MHGRACVRACVGLLGGCDNVGLGEREREMEIEFISSALPETAECTALVRACARVHTHTPVHTRTEREGERKEANTFSLLKTKA